MLDNGDTSPKNTPFSGKAALHEADLSQSVALDEKYGP